MASDQQDAARNLRALHDAVQRRLHVRGRVARGGARLDGCCASEHGKAKQQPEAATDQSGEPPCRPVSTTALRPMRRTAPPSENAGAGSALASPTSIPPALSTCQIAQARLLGSSTTPWRPRRWCRGPCCDRVRDLTRGRTGTSGSCGARGDLSIGRHPGYLRRRRDRSRSSRARGHDGGGTAGGRILEVRSL